MTKRTKANTDSLEKVFSRIVKIPSKEFRKIEISKPQKKIGLVKIGSTKIEEIKVLLLTLVVTMIAAAIAVTLIAWIKTAY